MTVLQLSHRIASSRIHLGPAFCSYSRKLTSRVPPSAVPRPYWPSDRVVAPCASAPCRLACWLLPSRDGTYLYGWCCSRVAYDGAGDRRGTGCAPLMGFDAVRRKTGCLGKKSTLRIFFSICQPRPLSPCLFRLSVSGEPVVYGSKKKKSVLQCKASSNGHFFSLLFEYFFIFNKRKKTYHMCITYKVTHLN